MVERPTHERCSCQVACGVELAKNRLYELNWQDFEKGCHLRSQDDCSSSVDVPEETGLPLPHCTVALER